MKTVLTTCPFCSCGCGLYLQAENGAPSGVAPSEHHPVSRGRLCARGWNAHEAPAWGERLTKPLVRRGWTLTAVSWEEALAAARDRMAALGAAGKSIGVLASARCTNEESYLATRLARGALATANLDTCLRPTYEPLSAGVEANIASGARGGTFADLEASQIVLVIEGDVAETHPQVASSILRAIKAGGKLVTVGCKRTQLARLATLHLAGAPGMEGDLLERLVATAAALKPSAGPLPRRRAAEAGAIPNGAILLADANQLREVAEWFAAAERASILIAPLSGTSGRAERIAAALTGFAAVIGKAGRRGVTILPLSIRGNLRGVCEMGMLPNHWPGRLPLADSAAGERLGRLWGRPPVADPGLDAAAMLQETNGLIVVAEDPPAVLLQARQVLTNLHRLEFLLVMDAFATETARLADVVLPIASFAENEGTVTSTEGRILPVRACAAPRGEARFAWQVLAELATGLGLPSSYDSVVQVRDEIAKAVPGYAEIQKAVGADGCEAWTHLIPSRAPRKDLPDTPRVVGSSDRLLALDGVFDWGSDPLVAMSPTLCREYVARRKLFPRGVVQMSKQDAQTMGVRQGWAVKLTTAHGETTMPAELRDDLEPGVLLVPFAFREHVVALLGGATEVGVTVTAP